MSKVTRLIQNGIIPMAAAVVFALASACASAQSGNPGSVKERLEKAANQGLQSTVDVFMGKVFKKGSYRRGSISETKLTGLFSKQPFSGSDTYPRVGLTVLEWKTGVLPVAAHDHGSYIRYDDECWKYKGVLWTDKSSREDVGPFTVCTGDLPDGSILQSLTQWAHHANVSWDNTDAVRSIGPLPPVNPMPNPAKLGLVWGGQFREGVALAALLSAMGFDWGNPGDARVWIVGFGADTPQIVSGKSQKEKEEEWLAAERAKIQAELAARRTPVPPNPKTAAREKAQALGSTPTQTMSVADYLLDAKTLEGQVVSIAGLVRCMPMGCVLQSPENQMHNISLDQDALSREDRKKLLGCAVDLPCKLTVTAIAYSSIAGPGLMAGRLSQD